jgi:hypothetical protein
MKNLTNNPPTDSMRLDSYWFKLWYVLSELSLAYIYSKPKMNIIFSKKDAWEPRIRRFSRYLPHKLTFAKFNSENIAEYDLIVPLDIEDVYYLDTVRHLIKDNAIPIPSLECIRLCDDKYSFSQALIANNFGDYIPQINGDLPYPYFLKKKVDVGGENSYLVENYEQEVALLKFANSNDYFRQKFISGKSEYSTYILFDKQRIIRSITLKHLFEKDGSINGRDHQYGTKMLSSPYLDIFTAILNTIGYEGLCCFDYKVVDNRPCIFEINPRFGGNLSLFFFSFIRSLRP